MSIKTTHRHFILGVAIAEHLRGTLSSLQMSKELLGRKSTDKIKMRDHRKGKY